MSIFKRGSKTEAQSAQAVTSEQQAEHVFDESTTTAALLEQHIAEDDPAAKAALELSTFTMTPGAKSLLDRALDNLSTNDGAAISDPEARMQIKLRAELLKAAGNDLSVVLHALVDSCEKPTEISGTVYSLCFNVLKASVFVANMDYRRWLDPKGDFDMSPYLPRRVEDEALGGKDFEVDARSEESPLDGLTGHDTSVDQAWHRLRELYGQGIEDEGDVFRASLDDLRLFMTLTVESFGWDADRPMPFLNVMEKDGSFTAITDAEQAMDIQEIKRQESRKRRAEENAVRMANAAERAKALLAGALKR